VPASRRSRPTAQRRQKAESSHFRASTVLPAVLVVALVFLVAIGSSRSGGRLSAHRLIGFSYVIGDLTVVLLALLVIGLGLLAYILLLTARESRVGPDRLLVKTTPMSWWARLVAVLVLLCVAAAIVAAFLFRGDTQDAYESQPIGGAGSGLWLHWNPGEGVPFVVHWWILAVLAIVALVTSLLVLLQRRRRRVPHAEEGPAIADDLTSAVQASLDELDEEGDARQAVIRAYAGMERALAEHGVGRKPSETHVEYLCRWTAAVHVTDATAKRLASLYELARFGAHIVDDRMKLEARSALLSLRGELEAGAP
jgi:hypothetical protein